MAKHSRKYWLTAILLPSLLFSEPKPLNDHNLTNEQRIELLENDAKSLRVSATQIEIDSQPLMFHDWMEYTNRMQKAKRHRNMAERIEAKITELKQKKEDHPHERGP